MTDQSDNQHTETDETQAKTIVHNCIDFLNSFFKFTSHARTPATWQDAMIYLRYKNHRNIDISPDNLERGLKALCDYQSLYLFDDFGFNKIIKIIQEATNNDRFFFDDIQTALGQDIRQLFTTQEEPKIINVTDLQKLTVKSDKSIKVELDKLYRYPEWIEYTPKADAQIRQWILEDKLNDTAVDYYLGTSEDAKNYAELYPVVKHILQNTNNYHLFFIAGDVLNLIWITSPEDEEIEGWLQQEIYNIFWPRIGGMWPLEHVGQIDFTNKDQADIFIDALGWILSLRNKTLQELNPDFWRFISRAKVGDFDGKDECSKRLSKKVFTLVHENDDFDKLLKQAEKGRPEYEELLQHPQNTEVAKQCVTNLLNNLTEELLPGKQEKLWRILGDNHYNDPDVRQVILETTMKYISRLPKENQLLTFEAACGGSQTSKELPLIESLAEIMREISPKHAKRIDDTLSNAKAEIAEIEAQTEEMREGLLEIKNRN